MAEFDFERRLERLFADAPQDADAGAFAERLERRLDRGWRLRRWLIGAAGLAGGLVAVSQLLVANVLSEVGSAETSARALSSAVTSAGVGRWVAQAAAGGVGVWGAVGVAVLMMGFVLSRVIEEI
jgi:hypothetical protein